MNQLPPCSAWSEKLALKREDLTRDEREALDAHVAQCSACLQAQRDYALLDAILRALPDPTVKAFPRLPLYLEADDKTSNDDAFWDETSSSAHARQKWQHFVPAVVSKNSGKRGKRATLAPLLAVACLVI